MDLGHQYVHVEGISWHRVRLLLYYVPIKRNLYSKEWKIMNFIYSK